MAYGKCIQLTVVTPKVSGTTAIVGPMHAPFKTKPKFGLHTLHCVIANKKDVSQLT